MSTRAIDEACAPPGLQDRITIRHADASDGLPGRYDVITTFDVVHDAVESARHAARHPRRTPAGRHATCAWRSTAPRSPRTIEGPIGALFQSCSVLLCLTLSLAGDGEGLGTLGLPEPKLREFGQQAGFGTSGASRWTTHSTPLRADRVAHLGGRSA